MVDHCFFILQKSCLRAITASNATALCSLLMILNNCLNMDYLTVLQNMLRERALNAASSLPIVSSPALVAGQPHAPAAAPRRRTESYMVILNNLEVSSDNIVKLKNEIEVECERVFKSAADREKVRVSAAELNETARNFKRVLQSNLEQVCGTIGPRIRSLVDIFAAARYELSEGEFAELEAGTGFAADHWIKAFTEGLDAILAQFRAELTPSNFDSLLHMLIQELATRLEKAVLAKRFNQLGGLQFDKDLRRLVSYFSATSRLSVRGEFARLTQIASLLNLEKVEEVLEYWGENAGHLTWRLTPTEVRKVLSRRVDFAPAAIAALKL